MIINGVNDILNVAIEATALRNRVINHNIANNDTPRYKKYEVHFEEQLQKIRENYHRTGSLDLSRFTPDITKVHTSLSHRIDGNNVDINEENVLLYRNSAIYDALVNSLIANRSLLTTIYNNLK